MIILDGDFLPLPIDGDPDVYIAYSPTIKNFFEELAKRQFSSYMEIDVGGATSIPRYLFENMVGSDFTVKGDYITYIGLYGFANSRVISVDFPLDTEYDTYAFYGSRLTSTEDAPLIFHIKKTSSNTFGNCSRIKKLILTSQSVGTIAGDTFNSSKNLKELIFAGNIKLNARHIGNMQGLEVVKIIDDTVSITNNNIFENNLQTIDIYVPWEQGQAPGNPPWGATNGIMHYGTVYDEDYNIITT